MKDKYEERDRLERMIISALLTDYDRFVDYIDIPYTEFGKQNWQISDTTRLHIALTKEQAHTPTRMV